MRARHKSTAFGQSLHRSIFEALLSGVTGWVQVVALQFNVYPLFGIHVPFDKTMKVATVVVFCTFVRQVLIRRYMNDGDVSEQLEGDAHLAALFPEQDRRR